MLRYTLTREAPLKAQKLQFTLLSAEEIERMSVCRVTETMLYYRGLPASGSLLDPLMGTVDRRHLCASCMRDARSCQGHAGHISLAWPVYHAGYTDTVLKVLRTVCFGCARLCLSEEERDAHGTSACSSGKTRLHALHAQLRVRKQCPHCGLCRPQYARTSLGIKASWPADAEWESEEEREYCTGAPFTARDAYSILRHMPEEDLELLGFHPATSHPKNMILINLVVPPPSTRPAIYSSEGSRSRGQNDLTQRLLEILKRNQDVQQGLPSAASSEPAGRPMREWQTLGTGAASDSELLERIDRLQYEVCAYFHGTARLAKPVGMGRSGGGNANSKSIQERLKGKEGRVRGNLMGKRVDFSARAVISPDAYFECDRVGVPRHIAKALTKPEPVTVYNLSQLAERVRAGAGAVHGARNIIHKDGTVTDLASCRDRAAIQLQVGDIVERHLADEDVVVFNRQPSLHMHSMAAHRVRLMPGNTFRIALPVATPYNADFDGDEMNLHLPQSAAATAECSLLMGVAQNCIGAQSSRPTMGIVQDSLVGLYRLTRADLLLDHAHLCRLLGCLRHTPLAALPVPACVLPGRQRVWTGKQVFSLLLPESLQYGTLPPPPPSSTQAPDQRDGRLAVCIRNGQLLCGHVTKQHVGASAGGIIDLLAREHGGVRCMRFMGDAQRVTHALLLQRSHHVGISDVLFSKEGHARVAERLDKAKRLCEEIQRQVLGERPSGRGGTSQRQSQLSEQQTREADRFILKLLSKTLQQTGAIVDEYMTDENHIRAMRTAGSKGSFLNLSQICAALGQQSLEGKRITSEKETRTLPCFAHEDASLASRGMVFNSFALGLSPAELFYHAVGGREGLVDTAVKTSRTGYVQRKMNKAMEDNVVRADGTVRNAHGGVISFRWGSDGFNPSRLERVPLGPLLREPESSLRSRLTEAELRLFLEQRARVVVVQQHPLALSSGPLEERVLLPFHPDRVRRRLLADAASDGEGSRTAPDGQKKVGPSRVLRFLSDFQAESSWLPAAVQCALLDLFCERSAAALPAAAVTSALEHVRSLLQNALAPDGMSVGCIAAQSIGEPCTQMTLNTFHSSGIAEKNVTLGIPRLSELLDASRNPKTPCTTLRFHAPYRSLPSFARYMASTLPLTRLEDVVYRCRIDTEAALLRDCASPEAGEGLDAWCLQHARCLLQEEGDGDGQGEPPPPLPTTASHLIVLELNQELMRARHLTPPMVRQQLQRWLRERGGVTSSEANCVDWNVCLKLRHVPDMVRSANLPEDYEIMLCHRVTNLLMRQVILSGHANVVGATAASETSLVLREGERGDAQRGIVADQWVVHTYGHFLVDCAAAEGVVDWAQCTSNDIWEVLHTLGIEACVHTLFDQIKAVVSFDGTYVCDRHMLMIADTMCRSGTLMPLNRHGINRTDGSVLMRCSFEETADVLYEAAAFSQSESARGVTASIMTGQLSNLGTGTVQVHLPVRHPHHLPLSSRCSESVGAVWRSTCRSHRTLSLPERVEYLVHEAARGCARLSPSQPARKRARFRTGSPTP